MPNPLKHFGVEYSPSTDAIHRRTLEHILANNLNNLKIGYASDYVLVGLLPSRDAADWFIEEFNRTIAPEAQLARSTNNWVNVTSAIEGLLKRALVQYGTDQN